MASNLELLRDIVAGVIEQRDQTLAEHVVGQNWKLEKAWHSGSDVTFEGWMSTPDLDLEKMIVEPEAFMDSLEDYFARRAPLSYVHNDKSLPAGHLQKAAIIRDGQVLKVATHPTDPAEFELPVEGTGVYVRGVVTETAPAQAIRKGNVGAMSWIGYGKEYEPLPGGVRRFTKVTPLLESTVAPYPVNTKAVIRLAKAFGLEETQTMENLEALMQKLSDQIAQQNDKLQKGLDEAAVKNLVSAALSEQAAQYEEKLTKAVADAVAATEEKLTKAFDRQGTGRVALTPTEEREADPAGYILKKSRSNEELSPEDKALAWGLMKHVLVQDLKD